jgi:hypothetical protein
MRKLVPFVLGFVLSFGLVRVALGDSGAAVPLDAGLGSAAGSASTAASAPLPDPVTDPSGSLSLAEKLYHSGAWFCLGILVLAFGLREASAHVKALQSGKTAVYVAALLGALGVLLIPVSQGTTPNLQQVFGALVLAVGLVMNPTKPAA